MDFSTATICDVIDVTLYKFNYYDNLIWTKCLNQIDYAVVNEDSILITPHQLRVLFDLNFERDLRKIEATTAELIHKDANSLYFLDKIITEFNRLKWIKLSLAKSRKFSRVVETNGNRTIRYSFKVLKTTLRLNEIFNPKDIQILNQYNRVSAHMILNKLDSAINGLLDLNEHEVELLATLIDIFEFKVEQDNPEVLLVTDW
jgi:hypothetical protein